MSPSRPASLIFVLAGSARDGWLTAKIPGREGDTHPSLQEAFQGRRQGPGLARRPLLSRRKFVYLMWKPEIAREMTRRWISEVPSKIV